MRTPFRLPIAYTCPALQVHLVDNRPIPYLSASFLGRCARRIGFICFFWHRRRSSFRGQHCRVGPVGGPVKLNVRRFWIHISQVMPGTGPGLFGRVSWLGVVYSVAGRVLWGGSFAIRIRGKYAGEFGDETAHELWKDGEGTADDTTGDFGDAICGGKRVSEMGINGTAPAESVLRTSKDMFSLNPMCYLCFGLPVCLWLVA